MEEIRIKLDPNRRTCGINKCREIIVKNFKEYSPDKVYELDRLCCGVMIWEQDNDDFILFRSSIGGDKKWYAIANKKTMQVCLEINFIASQQIEISLDKDEVVLNINNPNCGWHTAHYVWLDPKTYSERMLDSCKSVAKDVKRTNGELSFSTCYGHCFVTEKRPTMDDMRKDKFGHENVFCELF